MKVNNFTDYSFLFSNSSKANAGSSSFGINLADYASIKNGSYGKLMKVYYGKSNSTVDSMVGNTDQPSVKDKQNAKELKELQEDSDNLKESADALLEKGNKSVFTKKDITVKNEDGTSTTKYGYDVNAIYDKVKDFVADYNSMLKSGKDASVDSVVRQTNSMVTNTNAYKSQLTAVGISIGKNDELIIDEKAFKAADMEKVKSLFQTTGSFGYQASSTASQINFTADRAASKSNTYTSSGNYGNKYAYEIGNIYNSLT